ncbi:hypothetical protein [Streptomyces sp. NBC_01006]|uniref:hypothetical protein n=1 Tax=Streptomyces sp. NBC_01006 TaxID=2903716 RepID=UPI00386F430C|nr:hypothetical protein OG509_39170 [Streptomyces sp. NBC_01006]
MVNLHISAVNAMIFTLACLVAYVVYRRTKNPSVLPGRLSGDVGAALTAAATVLLMLAFLFGVGDGSPASAGEEPLPPSTASPSPHGN